MNKYNFTPRVTQVIASARQQASNHSSHFVQIEHLLLGLLRLSRETPLISALKSLGLNQDAFEATLITKIKAGRRRDAPSTPILSATLERVFALAQKESAALDHTFIGTEHLLLGVVRMKKSYAAQALARYGITDKSITYEKLGASAPSEKTLDYKTLYEQERALRVAAELRVASLANALREIIPITGRLEEIMRT